MRYGVGGMIKKQLGSSPPFSTSPLRTASMSYRGVKRVLGETRLELKCLVLFAICMLTLIGGSFWWYGSRTEDLVYDKSPQHVPGNLVDFQHALGALEQRPDAPDKRIFSKIWSNPFGEKAAKSRLCVTASFPRPNQVINPTLQLFEFGDVSFKSFAPTLPPFWRVSKPALLTPANLVE